MYRYNKHDIIGLLLQDLRNNHDADEDDIDEAMLREMSKIFDLMIEHDHLTRKMFDLNGILKANGNKAAAPCYPEYRTTVYPGTYIAFGYDFKRWLKGEDKRKRLDWIDLIEMIKEWSSFLIKVDRQPRGVYVIVRSRKHTGDKFRIAQLFDN